MAMDIPLWVGLLMAFGDMAVATYIGMRYGPERAKRLTVSEFKEPGTAAQVRQALGLASATDLAQWQLSMEARIKADMSASLTDALKQLPKPEISANITLPVSMQDAVQRDIRAVARSVMKEVVTADIQAMLDTAVQKALKQATPESFEAANAMAEEAELAAYLDSLAAQYNLPAPIVGIARKMGRAGVMWLDSRYGLGLQEVVQ